MTVEITQMGQSAVAKLAGSMTMDDSGGLLSRLRSFHQQHPVSRYVLDLGGLSAIDSSGLGSLIECRQFFREQNVDVCIAAVTGKVLLTFKVARADGVFKIYGTSQEALAAG